MSVTFLTAEFRPSGVLTNATTAKLSDATGAYGIKRNDTGAVVVADGTSLLNPSTGVYTYSFTDPAQDLVYTYALEFVHNGITYRITGQLTGGTSAEATAETVTEPTDAEMLTLIRKELKRRLTGGAVEQYTIGGRSAGTNIISTPLSELRAMEEFYKSRVEKDENVSAKRGTRTLAYFGRPR